MKKEELQKAVSEIRWFHRIPLPTDEGEIIVTPGIVDYCNEVAATKRFGIPEDLTGKTVLDCGTYDGYFAFEAERRGADVSAFDPLQGRGGIHEIIGGGGIVPTIIGDRGFRLAYQALNSKVKYAVCSLNELVNGVPKYSQRGIIPEIKFDYVFYFGILYHVDSPLDELKMVFDLTAKGGTALVETAIVENSYEVSFWDFRPGFDGDPTNKWYPTIRALKDILIHIGFKDCYEIYRHPVGNRCTMLAKKG